MKHNGQEAKEAVFECPFLLTKNAKNMRESLPALINVLGCPADSFLCGKYRVLRVFYVFSGKKGGNFEDQLAKFWNGKLGSLTFDKINL